MTLQEVARQAKVSPATVSRVLNKTGRVREATRVRVLKAVENVRGVLGPQIIGIDVRDQSALDRFLIEIDGTPNKAEMGANALLGVSLAAAKACADGYGMSLYRVLGGLTRQGTGQPEQGYSPEDRKTTVTHGERCYRFAFRVKRGGKRHPQWRGLGQSPLASSISLEIWFRSSASE